MISNEYMKQLSEFVDFLNGNESKVNNLATFWKYFKKNNANQVDQLPKFIMYISHDEIMGAFFKALGSDHIRGALPAADIYIEFFSPNATPS